MNKEEKEVEYLNAHINRLWTSMIVIGGGLSGILLSISLTENVFKMSVKIGLFLFGLFLILIVINAIISVDNQINKKIK